MKKTLYTFLLIFLTFEGISQTQRLVLVEEFTNASSGPCALANPAFNALMTANTTKVVAIRNHTNFPGYDPFYSQNPLQNQARTLYYQITSVPAGKMNGSGTVLSDINQTSIDAAFAVAPLYNINVSYHISTDNDSLYATATVKALSYITGTLKAHIVVVEKMIALTSAPGSNGEISFPMVMKKMLPTEAGTTLPSTMYPGDSVIINVGWLLANVFNINQLAVVSFVQDNVNKNVKQAAYAPTQTIVTPVTPPIITLNTLNNTLCGSSGSVNINVAGGVPPYTYYWSNGATSEDVAGLSIGNYSVTVTGGTASSTATYSIVSNIVQASISSLSDIASCSITMNWNLVAGADSYLARYKESSSTIWNSNINIGNVNSYIVSGLSAGTNYDIKLAAACLSGYNSAFSVVASDLTGACEMITSSSAINNSSTSATVSWVAPCSSIGYRIIYRALGTSIWSQAFVGTTYFTINNLLPNTTYEYRLRNRCGEPPNVTDWTPLASFTTPAQRIEDDNETVVLSNLSIYPNPTSSLFTVLGSFDDKSTTAEIIISNVLGEIIYHNNIALENGTFETSINLQSNLNNGVYFINLASNKNEKLSSRLLVQK